MLGTSVGPAGSWHSSWLVQTYRAWFCYIGLPLLSLRPQNSSATPKSSNTSHCKIRRSSIASSSCLLHHAAMSDLVAKWYRYLLLFPGQHAKHHRPCFTKVLWACLNLRRSPGGFGHIIILSGRGKPGWLDQQGCRHIEFCSNDLKYLWMFVCIPERS